MLKKRIQRMESFMDRCGFPQTPLAAPRPIRTPQDLLALLQEQIDAIRATPWAGPMQKAQAIGVLAGITRKILEDNNTAARIEMLENVLKQRRRHEG